jgi:hypothetical protein
MQGGPSARENTEDSSMLKLLRNLVRRFAGFLPLGLQRTVDSRFRAAAEVRKMKGSSVVVVSYPKSGRTWMRALLSYVFQGAFSLETDKLLGNKNYHRMDQRVPVVLFTHDNYPRRVFGDDRMEALYGARKVVLLVRDPRDVEVSAFFHVSYRMDPQKKKIYQHEASGKAEDLFDYLRGKFSRGRNALSFLNLWAGMARRDNVLIVRYEDLKADTEAQLRRICEFIGVAASDDCLRHAAQRASFSAMKKGERDGSFSHRDSRFGSRGRQEDDAFKVRRGKIGGYRDYLTPEQAAEIDGIIERRLVAGFGYRADEQETPVGRPASTPAGR